MQIFFNNILPKSYFGFSTLGLIKDVLRTTFLQQLLNPGTKIGCFHDDGSGTTPLSLSVRITLEPAMSSLSYYFSSLSAIGA